MSVAVLPMSKELGWTALERGLVSSVCAVEIMTGYSEPVVENAHCDAAVQPSNAG